MKQLAALSLILCLLAPASVLAATTQSATLNGTTQFFSILGASQTGTNPSPAVTVEAWVKFSSLPASGSDMAILERRDGVANCRSYTMSVHNTGGVYTINSQISADGTTGFFVNSNTITLTTGVWHHFAFTYNAGNYEYVYDGVSSGTGASTPATLYTGSCRIDIGEFSDAPSSSFLAGQVAAVRIWSVAQSAATINTNKCTVFGAAQTNMKAEWSLNGVLTDASGNSNTLTNNNSITFANDVPACFSARANVPFTDF